MPTIPYRSAGRPEAIYIIERLCDLAALQTGIDRIEIRRRNLIAPHELPYRNPFGVTYDNGEYQTAMDNALALSDWQNFRARRTQSKRRGMLRGIGLANYIELTMGFPREWSKITVLPDDQTGRVEVAVGTLSSGQGHETSFAQCVSEWLGVPFDEVRLVQGDTDIVPIGGGSHSGRSMRMAGFVMGKAADACSSCGRAPSRRICSRPRPDAVRSRTANFVLVTIAAPTRVRGRPGSANAQRPRRRATRSAQRRV